MRAFGHVGARPGQDWVWMLLLLAFTGPPLLQFSMIIFHPALSAAFQIGIPASER